MIKIKDSELREASSKGMDAFITLVADMCVEELGSFDAESMVRLNADQHTLVAYKILRDELMDGGFCQLIQNGYGAYIFHNPFAKALRLWGVGDLSKMIYAARKIYDENRVDLERERTDEEFMAMYENYEAFDDIEDAFIGQEEEFTAQVAHYVDEHLDNFVEVIN